MATKRSDFTEETTEVVTPELVKPALITHEYHREDLNELRDAVNYLLSK